ncbi:MAG: hypothetical protein MJ175_05115, partial [Clostridia bacterium]|nr:hypothetical protein [Clostridia bacterium]
MMKWVIRGIAVIAAVNLILLIFFSDRLFPEQKTEETTPAAKTVITISFDDDTVRYDGNGLFSVMNGVRAVDENGKDLTDHLTASIQPAAEAEDPMHSRVIYYAVRLRDGSYAEAERTLLLENYLLPSITFHGVGDV